MPVNLPNRPVDVQVLGIDFLAASGHKMCGPTGIGFLWGKEDILNSMPLYMGGGEMIDHVTWLERPLPRPRHDSRLVPPRLPKL